MTLRMETRPLAEQYEFYAMGDLMFAECSQEDRDRFAERVKREYETAQANGGVFRDGSKLTYVNAA